MVLLKYFKRVYSKKPEKVEAVLPKVDGPLATLMPVSSIEAINKVVRVKMMENASGIKSVLCKLAITPRHRLNISGSLRFSAASITTLPRQSRAPDS